MSGKPLPTPTRKSTRPARVSGPVSPPPAGLDSPRILRFRPRVESRYLPWKRALDWICALVLIVLTAPILLIAALLVKWASPGPAFYIQRRLGLNGRPFTIYKLRTMHHNCEALTGPRWCVPGDPRVTPLGKLLRATHLDELPQLFNVLCGDMSLIGPRPERPEFLPELEALYPRYRERLAVRPGITGLAQVQLPPDTEATGVCHKLACDLYYTQNVTFGLDARLLGCTALYAVGVPFRWSARLLRLPMMAAVRRALGEPLIVLVPRRKIA